MFRLNRTVLRFTSTSSLRFHQPRRYFLDGMKERLSRIFRGGEKEAADSSANPSAAAKKSMSKSGLKSMFAMSKAERERLKSSMESGVFTFEDYRIQMKQVASDAPADSPIHSELKMLDALTLEQREGIPRLLSANATRSKTKRKIAETTGASPTLINDVIRRFDFLTVITKTTSDLHREGKSIPDSYDEIVRIAVERGNFQHYRKRYKKKL